jgi:RNA polymerase sigma factor (sigma-70 family)
MKLKGIGLAEIHPAAKERTPENPFNAEYLQRLKSRDPEIENHFVSYFRKRLEYKVRRNQWRVQDADVGDVIHETFACVLQAVDRDAVRCPMAFGGYVNSVCEHVMCDLGKHRSSRHYVDIDEIDLPDPALDLETLLLAEERRELTRKVLDGLGARDRNLLRAKLFEELGTEEMCLRFGAGSADHLRILLFRARKKFAAAYKKMRLKKKRLQ